MDQQYNVYFAGELLPGKNPMEVRANLRDLFKADDSTLDKLFAGKPQLIKRACPKTTALKYKLALENAGAKPLIKRLSQDAEPVAPVPARPEPRAAAKTASSTAGMTMAERIAALTADDSLSERFSSRPPAAEVTEEPDEDYHSAAHSSDAHSIAEPEEVSYPPPSPATTVSASAAAAETDDLESFTLAAPGEPMLAEEYNDTVPTAAPDVSYLSMGAVGEDIPTLPRHDTVCAPDTSGIALAPAGSDFSDCAKAAAPAPHFDLSAMNLAPTGSDMLEQQYRKTVRPVNANIAHLALEQR